MSGGHAYPIGFTRQGEEDLRKIMTSPELRALVGLPPVNRPLVTLDKWNKSMEAKAEAINETIAQREMLPRPNGIYCPQESCDEGVELVDMENLPFDLHEGATLNVKIGCPTCKWEGTRIHA